MATVKSDLTATRRYLIEAYKALKDARTHCDGVVGVDGIHYQDVSKIMTQVDEMAHICKVELDRLDKSILTSKESRYFPLFSVIAVKNHEKTAFGQPGCSLF